MGDTKSAMQATSDKAKGLLGTIMSKKPKAKDAQAGAQTFADRVGDLDTELDKLIVGKEADLRTEKGQEEKNTQSLAKLRTMRFHLDEMIEQIANY